MHGGIKAALFRKIADLRRRLERAVTAQDETGTARRIDDAEKHPQGRGFTGAVGSKQAIYRARWNGQADPVDSACVAEILDEIDRLNRDPFVLSLSKH
jgi:hypothetical protein